MTTTVDIIEQAMASLRTAERLLGEYKDLVEKHEEPSEAAVETIAMVATQEPEPEPEPEPEKLENVPPESDIPASDTTMVLEPTEKIGNFSLDDYRKNGWTDEQLLAEGYAIEVAVPVDVPDYKMTAQANGASYEQYIEAGWTREQMLENGIIEEVVVEAAVAAPPVAEPVAAATPEWPMLNEHGQWVDSEGAVWNADLHSEHKGMKEGEPPKVNADGRFKATRRKKSAPAAKAPAAPKANGAKTPAAPAAPGANTSAPAAPAAPPAGGEEPVDAELASLVKGFNS